MKTMIENLLEKRGVAWHEMKALLDSAEAEKRELTGEEQEKFDRINADIDALDKRAGDLALIEERNVSAEALRAKFAGTGRPNIDRIEEDPLENAVRAFLKGESRTLDVDISPAADAFEVRNDGTREFRTLTVATAGGAGDTVPTSFIRKLYEHMVENSAIRQTNAEILTTASGENITQPKLVSHGTATIIGEGTAIAGTDPSVGKTTLGAYKYGELVQVSMELLEDSGVDILSLVAKTAGRAVGEASGVHFTTGSGTNQPEGIMTACGTGVTGATSVAGVPNADNLIDLYFSVIAPYRNNGFWLMRDATMATVRKLKDTTNQYLWQPGLTSGTPDQILGRPVITDPNVAATATNAKSIAFGDFSGFFIRQVRGVRFQRSDDFAFDKDLATFKAVVRVDSKLVDLTGCVKAFRGGAT